MNFNHRLTTLDDLRSPQLMRQNNGMIHASSVEESLDFCKQVTYTFAKTFYFASHFLRNEKKRNACYAIYAFCRLIDEITDHAESLALDNYEEAVRLSLVEWQSALEDVYQGKETAHPIMIAWKHIIETYSIPSLLPKELIEGCLMDTYIKSYSTFEELTHYCYKVASIVGLMTSEVFGYSSKDALKHAVELGIAMQLTNIVRDISEDSDKGRIYLPSDELEFFGVELVDIQNKEFTPELEYYLRYFVQRAHSYYEQADRGIQCLDSDSRLTVQLMSTNYRRILNKFASQEFNPFAGRSRLSTGEKIIGIYDSWKTVQTMP